MMISRKLVTGCTLCCLLLLLLLTTTISINNWSLVFHPDRYHGHDIQRGMFFEGWYYNMKLVNNSNTIAVIPGVFMNDDDRHSFLIIAYGNQSHYFRFPFEAFRSSAVSDEFRINISRKDEHENRISIFSAKEIIVDVEPNREDDATERIQMNITIHSTTPPKDLAWFLPGTMGPFLWLSFLQCYHHVLSMRHDIHGTIQFGQQSRMDVSGIGYLEKDWGQSFPSVWIWGQANQWISTLPVSASLFFSFAAVPMGFGLELPGFLVIFEHNNEFYYFNSYLLSIVHGLVVNNTTNSLSFTVYDIFSEYKLSVRIQFDDVNSGALMYAPCHGRMEKVVKEMLDNNAYFDVRLSRLTLSKPMIDDVDASVQHKYEENVVFESRTQHVAFEIHGDIIWLSEQFQHIYERTFSWCFTLVQLLIQHYRFLFLLIISLFVLLIPAIFT